MAFLCDARRLFRRLRRIVEHGSCLRPGHQRSIRQVAAVRERLSRGAQAHGPGRLELRRAGEPDEDEIAPIRVHRLGDGDRERPILRCAIVESPMCFHVPESPAARAHEAVQRAHLVQHQRAHFIERQLHRVAAEVRAVRVSRVRAHRHAM